MMNTTVKHILWSLLILIAVAGLAAARLSCDGMPSAAPATAPVTGFSSERALAHVRMISRKPHHSGSVEHRRVKEYILEKLRETGWEVRVQKTRVVRAMFPGYHTASFVENIAARHRGTGHGGAVLFMGHYDSVPTGPGASDDGAAVAAMLESMRALNAGKLPVNDVIMLFTDSEEGGLNGAQAFTESHPWRKDVRLVMNFEARGVRGPSTLFETGRGNGGVIPGYLSADPFANGNSLSNGLYALLPNDTDFTVLKEAGYPGLNFAYIGGMTRYHTMLDNLENLDPRSLQHHGEHILALARHFGNARLDRLVQQDLVYFPVGGNTVARYSRAASHLLAGIAGAAAIFLLAAGLVKRRLSPLMMLGGWTAALVGIAASVLATLGLWKLVKLAVPGYHAMTFGEPYDAIYYRIAFAALSSAIVLLIHRFSVRRLGLANYAAAAITFWLVTLAAAQIFMPDSGFLFLWPLIFALPAFVLILYGRENGVVPGLVLVALSVPAFLMMIDLLHNLYEGLGLDLSAPVGMLIALYLFIMAPMIDVLLRRGGATLPVAAAALCVLSLAGGIAGAGFDGKNPRPDSLAYGLDADTGKATWISCDRDLDDFTGQFFSEGASRAAVPQFFPMAPRCIMRPWTYLSAPAPVIPADPPRVVLTAARKGGGRLVTARVTSPRGARNLSVFIRRAPHLSEVRFFDARLTDAPFEKLKFGHRIIIKEVDYRNWMTLACQEVPEEGIELHFVISGKEPVEMRVMDISFGLPALPDLGYRNRTPRTMQSPDFILRESAMVVKKIFL